jgi:dihydrodipicolinate synthase/N-acetylneuraminate lyase
MSLPRRQFLASTAFSVASTWFVGIRASAGADASGARLTPEDFRRKLRGPMLSFPTCYTEDFQLDYAGMRRMIDRAVNSGVEVVTLTAGNNDYESLNYDEVEQLTRFMVEAVNGRALTIAATGPWWTGQSIEYAKFAEAAGADAVQVLMATGASDDGHLNHFREIASATKLPLVLHGEPSMNLWKQFLEIESLVAFKLEADHPQGLPVLEKYGDRLAIFSGGLDSMFLAYQPHGMRVYFSVFAPFAPDISMQIWGAAEENRLEDARQLINKYEKPFFEQWGKLGGQAFWRATLEHFGIASRWMRPPRESLTDAQMQEVKSFYDQLGLMPHGRS